MKTRYKDKSRYGVNILGSLCLWQCFEEKPQKLEFKQRLMHLKTGVCSPLFDNT